MKDKAYFDKKLTDLREELRSEVEKQFQSKLNKEECFVNYDEANCINFENNITCAECEGMISHIIIDHNIVIHPEGSDLDPIDLSLVMDVHDLMMLHYIALNEILE